MRKTVLLVAAAIFAIGLWGGVKHVRQAMSVPAEVTSIQCQQDSKFIAPSGYEIFRLAGTTIVMRCVPISTFTNLDGLWKKEEKNDPGHRYTDAIKYTSAIHFKKLP